MQTVGDMSPASPRNRYKRLLQADILGMSGPLVMAFLIHEIPTSQASTTVLLSSTFIQSPKDSKLKYG